MKKNYSLKLVLLCALLLGKLTLPAQETTETDASIKAKLLKQATSLHLSPTDISNALVSSSFTDAGSGIQYIYLQQAHHSIGVLNEIKTIAVKNGQVA